jgi:hypothetical protein
MYLLDTNIFVSAKNSYYPFDIVPGFWDWLARENDHDAVYTIESVVDEIVGGGDDLADWMKARRSVLQISPTQETQPYLQQVVTWAQNCGQFNQSAIDDFLAGADFYLVAQGRETGFTVVTHEVSGNSRRRIKIPDACEAMNVSCILPWQMLRDRHARFVLAS